MQRQGHICVIVCSVTLCLITDVLVSQIVRTSTIGFNRLIPYAKEIIWDHQCGFRRNRSTIDLIFFIRQILEKKWEYNEEVHQLFIDFKKAYDSVRREVLYKILIEIGIPRELVRLINNKDESD